MKLVSLNIEGRKHWERINPFFAQEKPDVICLQEIFELDAKGFAERFSMQHLFMPMTIKHDEQQGVALFSSKPLHTVRMQAYRADYEAVQPFDKSIPELLYKNQHYVLVVADVAIEGGVFTIGTTHFTWTPDGRTRDYQKEDAAALLKLLDEIPEIMLCGDFNMPRGFNELYDWFTARYEDAIPSSYVSSLDPMFHRAYTNPIEVQRVSKFMVDYLFLSNKYIARDVRLQFGLSDHGAVVATMAQKN